MLHVTNGVAIVKETTNMAWAVGLARHWLGLVRMLQEGLVLIDGKVIQLVKGETVETKRGSFQVVDHSPTHTFICLKRMVSYQAEPLEKQSCDESTICETSPSSSSM
jgi:hypothetical protein